MMVQKPSGGEWLHVKTLAFKVIKYLLYEIIDGVLSDRDLEIMKNDPNGANDEEKQETLKCDVCAKSFKTRNGLNIHKARMHINSQLKNTETMSAVDSS